MIPLQVEIQGIGQEPGERPPIAIEVVRIGIRTTEGQHEEGVGLLVVMPDLRLRVFDIREVVVRGAAPAVVVDWKEADGPKKIAVPGLEEMGRG